MPEPINLSNRLILQPGESVWTAYWDCVHDDPMEDQCYEPNIPGHMVRCPNCLRPRGDDVVPERREGLSRKLTTQAEIDAALTPDLVCPECDYQWADEGYELDAILCPNCETPLSDHLKDSGKEVTRRNVQDEEFFTHTDAGDAKANPAADRFENMQSVLSPIPGDAGYQEPEAPEPSVPISQRLQMLLLRCKPWIYGSLGVSLAGALGIGIFAATRPTEISMVIDDRYAVVPYVIQQYSSTENYEQKRSEAPDESYSPGDPVSPDFGPRFETGTKVNFKRRVCVANCDGVSIKQKTMLISSVGPIMATTTTPTALLAETFLISSCRPAGGGTVICRDEPPAPAPAPSPAPRQTPTPITPTTPSAPAAAPIRAGDGDDDKTAPPPPPAEPEYRNVKMVRYTRWDWELVRRGESRVDEDAERISELQDIVRTQRQVDGEPRCYVSGRYYLLDDVDEFDEAAEMLEDTFKIDCEDYDQTLTGGEFRLKLRDGFVRLSRN